MVKCNVSTESDLCQRLVHSNRPHLAETKSEEPARHITGVLSHPTGKVNPDVRIHKALETENRCIST